MQKTSNTIIYIKQCEKLEVIKFYIELLKEYLCENVEQLRAVEGDYIRQMGTLNNRIEARTKQEYTNDTKERKREYDKQRRENKREELNQQKREYYYEHKEECNKRNKESYYKNRETRLEKKKNIMNNIRKT